MAKTSTRTSGSRAAAPGSRRKTNTTKTQNASRVSKRSATSASKTSSSRSKTTTAVKNKGKGKKATRPVPDPDPAVVRQKIWDVVFGKFVEFWTPASAEEEEDDDDDDDVDHMGRVVLKPKRRCNGEGATISEYGYARLKEMYKQMDARIPELNGIAHIYEDYAGYGTMEVIEMQLCEYEKEAKRRHPAYQGTLLRISEALSFLFQSTDDNHWMMVEDGERVDQLVRVIGALFLHCVRGLAASKASEDYPADLDPPEKGGPIKNIGLMLGNMCSLADAHVDMGGWDESIVGWKRELLAIAKEFGIRVVTIQKGVEDYDVECPEEQPADEEEDDEAEEEAPEKWDFLTLWKAYKKSIGPMIGRPSYDLTKLTRSEKRKLSQG